MMTKAKKDTHPLAINIRKFQRYNYNYFSCEEVVFFEYLVVKANAFKQVPFFHSSETIFKETGIRKHALKTIIKRFENLNYISIEVKGMPRVKYFTVHYPKIQADLEHIYLLEDNGKPLYEFRQLLAEFFLPLVDTYQEKNTIKNIKKEYKKENDDGLSDMDTQKLKIFNSILSSLKLKLELTPSQYSYNDMDVLRALREYTADEVVYYLEKYYKKGSQKKLNGFLKFDDLAPEKLVFIEEEKMEEEKFIDSFIAKLQSNYDNRIKLHNDDKKNKRGKSYTALIVNRNIRKKIKAALDNKGEISITNAFTAYTDAVLKEIINPDKFLPYFFSTQFGEYGVIETYLDYFNMQYGYEK
jgi:hypothetical protein